METALPSMATEAPPTEKKNDGRRRRPQPVAKHSPLLPKPILPRRRSITSRSPACSNPTAGWADTRSFKSSARAAWARFIWPKQVSLDRNVAVKILSPQLAADPTFVARFTREAYAAAQLTHHNIVQIYDIGEDRDVHFFSMEFVEGQTLHGTVKKHGRLDPEAAVGYVLQAAPRAEIHATTTRWSIVTSSPKTSCSTTRAW